MRLRSPTFLPSGSSLVDEAQHNLAHFAGGFDRLDRDLIDTAATAVRLENDIADAVSRTAVEVAAFEDHITAAAQTTASHVDSLKAIHEQSQALQTVMDELDVAAGRAAADAAAFQNRLVMGAQTAAQYVESLAQQQSDAIRTAANQMEVAVGRTAAETLTIQHQLATAANLADEQWRMFESVGRQMAEFARHFDLCWLDTVERISRDLLPTERMFDRRIAKLLLSRGWLGVERHLSTLALSDVLEIKGRAKGKAIDRFICQKFRRKRFALVATMVKPWWTIPYLRARRKVIPQALSAHRQEAVRTDYCDTPSFGGWFGRCNSEEKSAVYGRWRKEASHRGGQRGIAVRIQGPGARLE
jgi:hypothetical protein